MILTLEVVGSDDSMVLLLLVLIVGELMLVSELESLPVDVRLADESKLDVLRSADEVEGFVTVETSECEIIKVELSNIEIDEEPLGVRVAVELDRTSVDEDIKLALESDVIDWVDIDVLEGWEASELEVDAVAVESVELVDGVLVSILVEL